MYIGLYYTVPKLKLSGTSLHALIMQVYKLILLQDDKLYYGPGARREIGIGPDRKYDEAEEIRPKFDQNKWKRVFVQTCSNSRVLQPGTWFLYCELHLCCIACM